MLVLNKGLDSLGHSMCAASEAVACLTCRKSPCIVDAHHLTIATSIHISHYQCTMQYIIATRHTKQFTIHINTSSHQHTTQSLSVLLTQIKGTHILLIITIDTRPHALVSRSQPALPELFIKDGRIDTNETLQYTLGSFV
jgi:hypothetical protein